MKHIKQIQSIATMLILIALVACSKENTSTNATPTDVRDKALGTYSGNANLKDSTGTTIQDTSTTFVIAKGTGNTITITEEGNTITTDAIAVNGNDLAGNIPSQTFMIGGSSITIKGYGNNNEQFGYQDAQKVISYSIEVADGPMKGSRYTVFATKK